MLDPPVSPEPGDESSDEEGALRPGSCTDGQCALRHDHVCPTAWDPTDPGLQLTSLYGASCFVYAAVGLLVVTALRPQYDHPPATFPSAPWACGLLFMQTAACLHGDVLHFALDSPWHPVDRHWAVVTVVLGGLNVLWIAWFEMLAGAAIGVVGLALLVQSRRARRAEDLRAYLRWHTLWHVVPCTLYVLWLLTRPAAYRTTADSPIVPRT